MLRGLSSWATRSCKKAVMRLAIVLSSAASSFLAFSSNSIRQAKIALHFFQGVSAASASTDIDQSLLGEVEVFEVVQVFKDRFAGVEALRTVRSSCQRLKAILYFRRKSDYEHGSVPLVSDTSIALSQLLRFDPVKQTMQWPWLR
mgnify:CR=1 FL=1